MALIPGTRLGPYEVTAQIGAGGMGEVYKATDTNLKRAVAIKVLPASVAADAERLARFQREAEVLAAFNHPNIAQIHGLEKSDGVTALVMELVEGPTLADRIDKGAIPIDEALPIAKQIAEALEAAHERGIIHRDLKPANVKVRPDGTVKVLDFGLAKAMELTGAMPASMSMSPTITTPAMTHAGMILGTAAYMSPEQARGKAVDKRADLWAFGCVLYEMLTGRRPFDGDDVAVTLGAVIHKEPDWRAMPADTPASIRRLLVRCLTKDPKGRIADASTARLEIVDAVTTATHEASALRAEPVRQPTWRRAAPVVAAAVVTGIAAVLGTWTLTRPPTPRPVHLTMAHPAPEVVGGNTADANVALSPDGRYIAYVASASPAGTNTLPLYVRALDAAEPRLLSSAARSPFFSPDGQWVGFVEGNVRLSKVALTGGPSVPIGDLGGAQIRGANWGLDEAIVFATSDVGKGLSHISAAGGSADVLTTPDPAKGEVDHVYPEVLPGGRAVLFTVLTNQGTDRSQIAVLDLATRTYRVVIQGGTHARYSASGHLVYGASGTLRAVAFDLARLEVRGAPVPVMDGVPTKATGAATFSLSSDGTLVYLIGEAEREERRLVWLDRMGREDPLGIEAPPGLRRFDDPVLSPDGTQVAVTLGQDTTDPDLWIWSMTRRALTRLTFEPGVQRTPVWARDGTKVAYQSESSGVFWRNADGTGRAEALLDTGADARVVRPYSWSADGRLLFYDTGAQTVGMVPSQGNGTATTLLEKTAVEARPSLSPDGRWVAYQSSESGRVEIYVRPFPGVDAGKWQVSTGGVSNKTPRWTRDGRSLLFGDETGLMEVSIETSQTFKTSSPQRVLTWPPGTISDFDVSRDGTKFLIVKLVDGGEAPGQLNVVLNWSEELKRLVPNK